MTRLVTQLQRASRSIPGVDALKRRLHNNSTACGVTYWLSSPQPNRGFRVITYHRIVEQHDPYYCYCIDARTFEWQLQLFRRFCAVLSLDEIVDRLDRGLPLPPRCVALTFDDGYRDTATIAWPLLQRYRLPAAVYVAIDALDRGWLWPDRFRAMLRHTRAEAVGLESLDDGGARRFPLATQEQRLAMGEQVGERLKRMPDDRKDTVLGELTDTLGVDLQAQPRMMLTWDELAALRRAGMTVGSHTIRHPILSRVSLARAEEEIVDSKGVLERRLGVPIRHFAYPNGQPADMTPDVIRYVEAAGYATATTTVRGINRATEPRWALKRIDSSLPSLRALVRTMVELEAA